ncbi:MAG: DUF2892 domain-containing protein [archaeon]
MEKNVGKTDKSIRLIVGIIALILAYIYSVWWLVVAVIALATSITGKCPVYTLFSKKKKEVVVKKAASKKKKK